MKNTKSISYKVALGGIVSSLCLVCMFLTGIFPVLYITLPMIAGILMMIMALEISTSWAVLTYTATSILSLFVSFDKEAALLYIMFFGYYPIIKQYLDNLKPFALRLTVKTAVFNISVLSEMYISIQLLAASELYEQMLEKSNSYIYGFIALLNITFFSYDYAINSIKIIYYKKIKPKLR